MPKRKERPTKLKLAATAVTKAALASMLRCVPARITEWVTCGVLSPPAVRRDGLVSPRLAAEQLLAVGAILPIGAATTAPPPDLDLRILLWVH